MQSQARVGERPVLVASHRKPRLRKRDQPTDMILIPQTSPIAA